MRVGAVIVDIGDGERCSCHTCEISTLDRLGQVGIALSLDRKGVHLFHREIHPRERDARGEDCACAGEMVLVVVVVGIVVQIVVVFFGGRGGPGDGASGGGEGATPAMSMNLYHSSSPLLSK